MKKSIFYILSMFVFAFVFTGCSNDDSITNDPVGIDDGEQFIIAATPLASEGVADYLLTADDLSQGSVSLTGSGIEQDGTFRYYVTTNNKFFSLLYGQENPGAVTTYELNGSGNLVKLSNFQSESVHAFTVVNDDILMIKIPRDGSPLATWYQLSTESLTFTDQGQINLVELAGNGEAAFFTWIEQVGDKVFAPYMSVKGCCNDLFGTVFPNQAWIAVYSYPEMTLDTIIKDDRTSFIGNYFTSGLEEIENGDVYAFSGSEATNNGVFTSNKPSAIIRIKKGELAFDQNYFFNLEEASGGYYVTEKTYLGNGKFILMMNPVAEKEKFVKGRKLAMVDVLHKTFSWVQGLPKVSSIINVSTNNFVSEDGSTVYIGITTKESSFVYNIDIASATATQGLEVEGGKITAISHLETAE